MNQPPTPQLTPDQDRQKTIDLHANDLKDIDALRKEAGFDRYFLRRIREKRKTADDEFRDLECDPLKREGLRQKVKAYDEVLKMMDTDFIQSTQILQNLLPQQPA